MHLGPAQECAGPWLAGPSGPALRVFRVMVPRFVGNASQNTPPRPRSTGSAQR
jgi:hypothetical protein